MIACFDVAIAANAGASPVVEDLSLQIEAGSWHEIVGPAGTGKSAIFDVMTLRRKPLRGRLVVAGRNVARLSRRDLAVVRREVGSCPQRPVLLPRRTAVENTILPMVVRGQNSQAVEVAEETLGFLGMLPERDKPVGALCDQRRALVGLAMATVGEPAVVVIDGIHETLEPAVRGVAMSWLERLCEAGSTVIVFGRRPVRRSSQAIRWRLRDGQVETTGEVERC